METDQDKVQEAIAEREEGFGDPNENSESNETGESLPPKETPDDTQPDPDKKGEEGEEEGDEPGETGEEESKDGEGEEGEGTADTEGESEDESDEDVKKSNVQKRIDQLTAKEKSAVEKNRILEERLAKLEEKDTKKHETVYTDAQLDSAEKKAIEDNDMSLMFEINKERNKNMERKLRKQYEQEKSAVSEKQKANTVEWNKITNWCDRNIGENPRFDIRNQKSDLFMLSKKKYEDDMQKDSSDSDYDGLNGMLLCVIDAFHQLSATKTKKKSSREKLVERKLAKERLKSSMEPSSSEQPRAKTKPKKTKSDFDEYIEERKKSQSQTRGI